MKRKIFTRLFASVTLLLATLFSGCITQVYEDPCNDGYNGRPGNSYFGLDWTATPPSYVWTNNTAIPHVFQYGSYYYSSTGTFRLYYEGSFYEECCLQQYFWDVYFEIWRHPGSSGGCNYNGINGVDSYLMLLCDPYGPIESRLNRTTENNSAWKIVSDNGTTTIAELTDGDITIRIRFEKLDESINEKLDPSGIVIGKK